MLTGSCAFIFEDSVLVDHSLTSIETVNYLSCVKKFFYFKSYKVNKGCTKRAERTTLEERRKQVSRIIQYTSEVVSEPFLSL